MKKAIDVTDVTDVPVETEETAPAANPAQRRKTATAPKKPKARMGRRPIGPKTMSVVLQVRMTTEMKSAVDKMGGSTWARGILDAALKRAAKRGVKLPRAYMKFIEKN